MQRDLRVIYTSYQQYAIQIGIKLKERYGWKPVYWFTDPATENEAKVHFPDTIFHDYMKAIKGIKPEGVDHISHGVVDETLLNDLAVDESIALNMMERNDSADTFTHRERLELYHYHLAYWNGMLDHLQPDIIVFEEEPHQAVDYVLYALAKKRNIETVMFVRTSFFGRMFPVKQFEKGSALIQQAYLENNNKPAKIQQFASDIQQFLEKLKGNYDEVRRIQLYDQTDRIDKLRSREPGLLDKVGEYSVLLLKLLNFAKLNMRVRAVVAGYKPDYNSDQKVPGKKFNQEWFTKNQSAAISARTLHKKMKLRKYYEANAASKPEMNVPFILCALSYQPEKTTSPMGGHYVNQLLMVQLLRKAMPPEWKLYVKDHISQFSWYTQFGEQHRSKEFYDSIRTLPNTELIPLFYDTFTLVDHCKAVATITGSIGFEALIRGKAVLTFGHPWYKFCEGELYSGSYSMLRKHIGQLENGYTPDSSAVNRFIETIQEHTFEGVVGGRNIVSQGGEKGEPGRNADEHIKAIISILK